MNIGRALRKARPEDARIAAAFSKREDLEKMKKDLEDRKRSGKHQMAIIMDVSSNGHKPHIEAMRKEEGYRSAIIREIQLEGPQSGAASMESGHSALGECSISRYLASKLEQLLAYVLGPTRYHLEPLGRVYNSLSFLISMILFFELLAFL
jgi:hypothetical protein